MAKSGFRTALRFVAVKGRYWPFSAVDPVRRSLDLIGDRCRFAGTRRHRCRRGYKGFGRSSHGEHVAHDQEVGLHIFFFGPRRSKLWRNAGPPTSFHSSISEIKGRHLSSSRLRGSGPKTVIAICAVDRDSAEGRAKFQESLKSQRSSGCKYERQPLVVDPPVTMQFQISLFPRRPRFTMRFAGRRMGSQPGRAH